MVDLQFMLDDLPDPEVEVRRPDVSGLGTLAEVSVLVAEAEHLHGGALAQRVRVRVQQVAQPSIRAVNESSQHSERSATKPTSATLWKTLSRPPENGMLIREDLY